MMLTMNQAEKTRSKASKIKKNLRTKSRYQKNFSPRSAFQNIEKIKDEETQRQILTLNIKTKILKAIEDIRMVHMEGQIQAHKDKLEKERQQNPNAEDKRVEPKKMSVWHVPVEIWHSS